MTADDIESAVIRKVVYSLTDADPENDDSIFEAANQLITKIETMNRRIADLEAQVDPDPDGKTYEEKDRDDLVFEVRKALAKRALNRDGKAQMIYTDILALFDENPSDAYAYKLMNQAGKADGFDYDERSDQPNRVIVDVDAVKDERVIYAVNNNNEREAPA